MGNTFNHEGKPTNLGLILVSGFLQAAKTHYDRLVDEAQLAKPSLLRLYPSCGDRSEIGQNLVSFLVGNCHEGSGQPPYRKINQFCIAVGTLLTHS